MTEYEGVEDENAKLMGEMAIMLEHARLEIQALREALRIRASYMACPECKGGLIFSTHHDDCKHLKTEREVMNG